MDRRLIGLLDNIMGVALGIFIVSSVLKYMDFKKHPHVYMVQSAPWYVGIIISGIFTLIILLVAIFIKYMLIRRQG